MQSRSRRSPTYDSGWPYWAVAMTCSSVRTSGLWNVSAHAPGSRRQRERAILAISKQALAHARFELLAAILGERHDVSTARACACPKRNPNNR